ncbi:hypothetical protein [Nocardiopsis trehalosi]|uniref:hypothetical protein n=1 Tax=Nocardiopsis trehalosi TaxID=109329 RepID=UPI000831202A|nr:hypothetical protein [Nocardiopsis trehalosi]
MAPVVGGIVLAAFAVIYALVIRKVSADNRAAAMELVSSQKELRNKGEQDYVAIDKALTTGEGHQRYVNENSLTKDDASRAQYAMAAALIRQSATTMERYRSSFLNDLSPYMEGDNPRIAYAGKRTKKLKLVDDSHLNAEQKDTVTRIIKEYNDTLAVSPRRSFLERFNLVEPVDLNGRADELHYGMPPDQDPPILDPAAFDEALGVSVPHGIRAVLGRRKKEGPKEFKDSSLYQRARHQADKALARRAAQNGGKGKGPSA